MGRAFEVRKASMMKTGLAKAKIYTRHSREIYLAAKNGSPDPEANLNLKRAIDRAKKDQVPADIIKRAIDKVASGGGEDLRHKRYEGFGPSGSTILVDCLTDNDNRTISEVKNCFTKTSNNLGVAGAVAHLYEHIGVILVKDKTEDDILELLMDNDMDAKEIEQEEDLVSITTDVPSFLSVKQLIQDTYGEESIDTEEITWVTQTEVELAGDDLESFQKLLDMLNEVDDVQNIYHNVTNI